eukprot:CAMPEP_0168439418 /NCGR_PEP_ID=MMETSP0228-20121227/42455_1 /TAXON_ID=133427 /ORGANISM="Protoceratium reticulatum, Strain CCCM 535 (=CCMP 1889)" /LENGTH=99 /DNA_ID=CAMNT_0008453693 /DNA_START=61 /DNA_END=357 /DNA_ORIENTATION=-
MQKEPTQAAPETMRPRPGGLCGPQGSGFKPGDWGMSSASGSSLEEWTGLQRGVRARGLQGCATLTSLAPCSCTGTSSPRADPSSVLSRAEQYGEGTSEW